MRIYTSAFEAIKEVERDLWEMGTDVPCNTVQDRVVKGDPNDGMTKELVAYGYMISQAPSEEDLRAALAHTGCNYKWALHESEDRTRLDLINPGMTWQIDRELWGKYIRKGRFAYTYNERIREQLERLIEELKENPNTRQGIITMYDRHQDMNNWGGVDRVPCTMHYQFVRRLDKLNIIYVMRSCDFLKHFATDLYLATALLKFVAREIGSPVGTVTHFMGSLHAFHGDMKKRGIF